MARSPQRNDEDELDPVEAADETFDDEDEFDGFSNVGPDGELEYDEDAEDEDVAPPEGEVDEEDEELVDLPAALAADEDLVAVVAAAEVDDDPDEDALREGEFVCRSCFMAKRESALADEDAMLCRDCV